MNNPNSVRPLLAALAVVLAATTFAGCGGWRSEQYRKEGDTYLELGKFEEAAAAYARAEKANPENAWVKVGLGKVALASDEMEDALGFFEAALALDPTIEPAYEELVTLLLRQQRWEEAREVAERLGQHNEEKSRLLQALSWRLAGQTGRALEIVEVLAEENPDDPDVLLELANEQYAASDYEAAAATAQRVLDDLQPDSLLAGVIEAEARHFLGSEAAAPAGEAEEAADSPSDALRLLYAGKLPEAESAARELIRLGGEEAAWGGYVLGRVHLERKQRQDAQEQIAGALARLPEAAPIRKALDDMDQQSNRPVQTAQSAPERTAKNWEELWQMAALSQMLQQKDAVLASADPLAREKLVMAALISDPSQASSLAEGLPEGAPLRTLLERLQDQDPEAMAAFLRDWPETEGDSEHIRQLAIGYTLGEVGARAQGLDVLLRAASEWPDNGVALLSSARVFMRAGMPGFSVEILRRLLAQYPESLDAQVMLYDALKREGKQQEAVAVAVTANALFPDSLLAMTRTADARMQEGEYGKAARLLRRAVAQHPDEQGLTYTLARVLLFDEEPAEALAALDSLEDAQTLRALAYADESNLEAAAGALAHSSSEERSSDAAHYLTAAAFAAASQPQQAVDALFAQDRGSDTPLLLAAPIAAALQGNMDTAGLEESDSALASALAQDTGAIAALLTGLAFNAAGMPPRALEYLSRVDAALGGNLRLAQIQMSLLTALPNEEEAVQRSETLVAAHPDSAALWLGRYAVLQAHDVANGQKDALDKAIALDDTLVQAWFLLGAYNERQNDTQGAIAAYSKAHELAPDSPPIANNLAYNLILADQNIEEAKQLAKQAVDAAGANPHFLHTLGVAQMRTGDYEGAQQSISRALTLRPGDPTHMYDYGRTLIELDDTQNGLNHIQRAITYADRLGLDFPKREEAEEMVREHIGSGSSMPSNAA